MKSLHEEIVTERLWNGMLAQSSLLIQDGERGGGEEWFYLLHILVLIGCSKDLHLLHMYIQDTPNVYVQAQLVANGRGRGSWKKL